MSKERHQKFWEIELDEETLTTWWGRIGTEGQSKRKEFDSEEQAKAEYNKLIKEKTGKGYKLVDSGKDDGEDDQSDDDDDGDDDDDDDEFPASLKKKAG